MIMNTKQINSALPTLALPRVLGWVILGLVIMGLLAIICGIKIATEKSIWGLVAFVPACLFVSSIVYCTIKDYTKQKFSKTA